MTEPDRSRCYAAVGTAFSGPVFCGYPAKAEDANGRPCCGRHLGKQVGIEWFNNRRRYPYGFGEGIRFAHGGGVS